MFFCLAHSHGEPCHWSKASRESEEEGVAQRLAQPSRQGHRHNHEAGHQWHIEEIGGVAVTLFRYVNHEGAAGGEAEAEAELGKESGAAKEKHLVGLRIVRHQHIGKWREGQYNGCWPEKGAFAMLLTEVMPQCDAKGEGQHPNGALSEANILDRAAKTSLVC